MFEWSLDSLWVERIKSNFREVKDSLSWYQESGARESGHLQVGKVHKQRRRKVALLTLSINRNTLNLKGTIVEDQSKCVELTCPTSKGVIL